MDGPIELSLESSQLDDESSFDEPSSNSLSYSTPLPAGDSDLSSYTTAVTPPSSTTSHRRHRSPPLFPAESLINITLPPSAGRDTVYLHHSCSPSCPLPAVVGRQVNGLVLKSDVDGDVFAAANLVLYADYAGGKKHTKCLMKCLLEMLLPELFLFRALPETCKRDVSFNCSKGCLVKECCQMHPLLLPCLMHVLDDWLQERLFSCML
ncbi:unnamed protein product [Victoria cruziana]